MGSSLSKIEDDYDDYVEMCKITGLNPQWSNFYTHQEEILKSFGCRTVYDFFKEVRIKKNREDKIDSIINPLP
jgi:hypothetical protein